MNKRIETIYKRILNKEHSFLRNDKKIDLANYFELNNVPYPIRASIRLKVLVQNETPFLFKEDRIGFYRRTKFIPPLLTKEEIKELSKNYNLFEGGYVTNISSDYESIIKNGFKNSLKEIENSLLNANKDETIELIAMKDSINSILELVSKYRDYAKSHDNIELLKALNVVPFNGATSFYEASVFLRILNYSLWLNGNKHNTLGRFDQYMYPYFLNDLKKGVTKEEIFEIIEELFISFNIDSDLYPGIQQGDNGQSLVLGGVDKFGNDAFNELTELCLKASLELKMIDPKINLRVSKNTPSKWFELGTLLTKEGLGFPQYSNDDVVIKSLVNLGYDLEDARDYVVAACWEFIIPKVGLDVPNVGALNFPKVINNVIFSKEFKDMSTFDEFLNAVKKEINKEVLNLVNQTKDIFYMPSPFQSVLMKDCIKNKKDCCFGLKYNNFGLHGAGLSNATDALEAIKLNIFDKHLFSKEELIDALTNDFIGFHDLQKTLSNSPKFGNNIDEVDTLATFLLHEFSNACSKHKNSRGGIYRAGTGSAMYYIRYGENLIATADGRNKGEPLSANYSPSLSFKSNGVLSVIQSFTKPNLFEVCNGGPLTLEFHDTLFRNEEGIKKVASLVKTFIYLNGHQLQLNAINKEKLLEAQKHPEKYPNLIVRVWGWSGKFNELDFVYQNHIIKRLEYSN